MSEETTPDSIERLKTELAVHALSVIKATKNAPCGTLATLWACYGVLMIAIVRVYNLELVQLARLSQSAPHEAHAAIPYKGAEGQTEVDSRDQLTFMAAVSVAVVVFERHLRSQGLKRQRADGAKHETVEKVQTVRVAGPITLYASDGSWQMKWMGTKIGLGGLFRKLVAIVLSIFVLTLNFSLYTWIVLWVVKHSHTWMAAFFLVPLILNILAYMRLWDRYGTSVLRWVETRIVLVPIQEPITEEKEEDKT